MCWSLRRTLLSCVKPSEMGHLGMLWGIPVVMNTARSDFRSNRLRKWRSRMDGCVRSWSIVCLYCSDKLGMSKGSLVIWLDNATSSSRGRLRYRFSGILKWHFLTNHKNWPIRRHKISDWTALIMSRAPLNSWILTFHHLNSAVACCESCSLYSPDWNSVHNWIR